MSIFESQLLSWKSRATQQKERENYEKWAFPFGQKQRDNLQKLLFEVYPKETVPTTLIPFLTCKELFEKVLSDNNSIDGAIDTLINKQKKFKRILKKKDMATYIALVLADAAIDEQCIYPAADEIRARAVEIESVRREN